MILNYRLHIHSKKMFCPPVVFIHGLFGNLSNLNTLSRALNEKEYSTLQVDLRNHGQSIHDMNMDYNIMAQDIFDLLNHLSITCCTVVGHSLGGKVAMVLPKLSKNRIIKIVIIDIAPITYTIHKHLNIFAALNYVTKSHIVTKNEAFNVMKKFINNNNVIFFLLKSFKQGKWDFNVYNIEKNYITLTQWEEYTPWLGEALFIRGEHSSYVKPCYYTKIYQQFPKASIHVIKNAGHWVHVDKKNDVLNLIDHFLLNNF